MKKAIVLAAIVAAAQISEAYADDFHPTPALAEATGFFAGDRTVRDIGVDEAVVRSPDGREGKATVYRCRGHGAQVRWSKRIVPIGGAAVQCAAAKPPPHH